jgi:ubiquinone/menaquinone biosynthesis C-methylase UbiE
MNSELLKKEVHDYWNKASCGTEITKKEKFSFEYFEEIEEYRYRIEPEIFSFAQFSRAHGKKVLEVGIGAATDFMQWARSGALIYGIDLTQEAVNHAHLRLDIYNLKAQDIRVADAERLPYSDNYFDLVYSWGVIHHSPNTKQCLSEIIRVTKPGGHIKIMIYNRHSLFAFYQYLRNGLLKGKPFQTFSTILFNHQESLGTKAYTIKETKKMIVEFPVVIKNIQAPVTKHDLLYYRGKFARSLAYLLACIFGWNSIGWFIMIELEKK